MLKVVYAKFLHQYTKKSLYRTFQISKILRYSYSEIESIQAHCNRNLKPKTIFFIPNDNYKYFFFIFPFFLLSPLSLSFSLFPITSVSLRFTVWAPPLQGSSVRNFKAQMHLKCCHRYGGRAWRWGDLILWVVDLWFRIVIGVGLIMGLWFRILISVGQGYGFVISNCDRRGSLGCGLWVEYGGSGMMGCGSRS